MKVTAQDRIVLKALNLYQTASSSEIAHSAKIRTMSRSETAARHLIKLTKLGLAEKTGSRKFPRWAITYNGREFLSGRVEQDP